MSEGWSNQQIFSLCVKARTSLMNGSAYLAMAQNPGIRVILLQLPEQIEHGAFLRIRPRIGRIAFLVKPTFITDTDALVVPAGDVGTNLMNRTADVNLTIASDIKMIADAGKSSRQMAAAKRLHREMTVTASSAAMNYQEAHLPIILIETSCPHRSGNDSRTSSQTESTCHSSGYSNDNFEYNTPL